LLALERELAGVETASKVQEAILGAGRLMELLVFFLSCDSIVDHEPVVISVQ
jgi:hypothetical protein